jgi:adenylate cyclase
MTCQLSSHFLIGNTNVSLNSIVLPGQTIIPLGIAVAHIALCLYVLFRRQLDDAINRLFIAYLLVTILWNINLIIVVANVATLLPAIGWLQLVPYGLIGLGLVYWTFARAFLHLTWWVKWVWLLGFVGLLIVIGLDLANLIWPAAFLSWSQAWLEVNNLSFLVGLIWWGLLMALTLTTIRRQQTYTQSLAHKNRIQYLFVATLLLVIGYLLFLAQQERFWLLGPIIIWLSNTLLTYTVVTEDLVDLRTLFRRSVGFVMALSVTVSIYLASIYLVQIFLGDWLASSGLSRYLDPTVLVAAVTAVLLAIVYPPLSRVTRQLTNRLLFGQYYDYQLVIQHYSRAVSHILELAQLARVALTQINWALPMTKGALLILDAETVTSLEFRLFPGIWDQRLPALISLQKETAVIARLRLERQALAQYTIDLSPQFKSIPANDRQTLQELDFEWFVPILKQQELLGIFALGPQISGRPYTVRDLRLLATLADQTALALENATLFDRAQRNLIEMTGMKHLMDNVFNSIDSGVITITTSGQVNFINQAASSILAIPADGCLGRPYREVLPALAETIIANLMRNVINQGEHYSGYELVVNVPGRGKVDLRLSLTPLRNAHNQPQGVTIVLDDITETRRLQAVHDMFRRYLSPAVVDRLPSDPANLRLGGHRQEVTILFADIRGFTTFSEHLPPETLVDNLNQYLSMAATSILMYEGTLDKFVGDAVMGIFNAPLKQEDHTLRAVRAAAAMQRAITDYHHSIGQVRQLSFGVGIHMGEVVVGNVGMSDRMDYTAIGDAVNVAKRIQENAPGGMVLLSQAVYDVVKQSVKATFYQEMKLRNREQPVPTYELHWM